MSSSIVVLALGLAFTACDKNPFTSATGTTTAPSAVDPLSVATERAQIERQQLEAERNRKLLEAAQVRAEAEARAAARAAAEAAAEAARAAAAEEMRQQRRAIPAYGLPPR